MVEQRQYSHREKDYEMDNDQSQEEGAFTLSYCKDKEFIVQFLEFSTFEESAAYIADWIKVQMHQIKDFSDDLPSLLQFACDQRNHILGSKKECYSIFAQCLDGSESDFIVQFVLNLLEACSINDNVPMVICRVILGNIYAQIQDNEIELNKKHQEFAIRKIKGIRTDLVSEYINRFKLQDIANDSFFKKLIQMYLENFRFSDAAVLIHKFKFQSDFDCFQIIDKLSQDDRQSNYAKLLCEFDIDLKNYLINSLIANRNCKQAAKIIAEFKFDINAYPDVQATLMKASVKWYLSRYLFKKPSEEDYLSLDRVEDLFLGYDQLLVYLVEDLVFKGKLNEAAGICERNNLHGLIRGDIKYKLAKINYDSRKDQIFKDAFGPLQGDDFLKLPDTVNVVFISKPEEINELDHLLTEQYIGIDSEWRPNIVNYHDHGIGLLQISGSNIAFLIDMISLKDSVLLDDKLSLIFSNEKSLIIGFSFHHDIQMFSKKLPKMKFYKFIKNFIDAQTYLSKIQGTDRLFGLAKVCDDVFGKQMCKKEQVSNWERRPLRLSQQHYAALDAYVMIEIIKSLSNEGQQKGHEIEKYISILDNTNLDLDKKDDDAVEAVAEKSDNFRRNKSNFDSQSNGRQVFYNNSSYSSQRNEDFTPSKYLKPEMKNQGFIVDKYLISVGKMINQKGYDCVIVDDRNPEEVCRQAIKENRVYVTDNRRIFNMKGSLNIACLKFKDTPQNQFKALNNYFKF